MTVSALERTLGEMDGTGNFRNDSETIHRLNEDMTHTVLPVTIFISFEMLIGLCGNVLIFLVYFGQYEKSNFRIFVLFMAFTDITSCLTTLPGEIFTQLNWYDNNHVWICKVKSFFNIFTAWSSASVLMLLAVDRNRKVCRPLKRQMLEPLVKRLCFVSLIVSVIIAAPVLILWGRQTYSLAYEDLNLTVAICEKADAYKKTIYPFLYIGSVYFVPVGVMVISLMFLNCMTAWTLFGHRHKLCESNCSAMTNPRPTNTKSSSTSLVTLTTNLEDMSTTSPNIVPGKLMSSSTYDDLTAKVSEITTPTSYESTGAYQDPVVKENNVNDTSNATCQRSINNQYYLPTIAMDSKPYQGENDVTISVIDTSNSVPNSDGPHEVHLSFSPTDRISPEDVYVQKQATHNEREISTLDTTEQCTIAQSSPPYTKRLSTIVCCMCMTQPTKKADSIKRKTVIMLVLTSVFAVTMTAYVVLVGMVAARNNILQELDNTGKVVYFFFLRLYFINTNINPILYGFMDPRFRAGLLVLFRRKKGPS